VVEADFAVDSSGLYHLPLYSLVLITSMASCGQQHEWVKVHLMCGVKTNVVTAVEIRRKMQ